MSDTYFTGKPCRRGHVAERTTRNRTCVECAKLAHTRYRRKNSEARAQQAKTWRERNTERAHAENRRRVSEWQRKFPDKVAARNKRWKSKNAGAVRAQDARRRAAEIQRTPVWADAEAIRFFYECRPAGCHVDHIIPLQGELVSGLHVETNLQWLPAAVNMSKGNRYAGA